MARSGVAVEILCCVQDILREARGCRFCGLDRTVWIFLLAHGGGLALLLCTDTDLSLRVSGAHGHAPSGATPGAPARALTADLTLRVPGVHRYPPSDAVCTLCRGQHNLWGIPPPPAVLWGCSTAAYPGC